EQAEKLLDVPAGGRPRQADIRRAISAAYYGIFHATLAAAADMYVGASKRASVRYGLIYRSIDHRRLREICEKVTKPQLQSRYRPCVPASGFRKNIAAFATAVVELQQKRHAADYDPMKSMTRSDAMAAVATARAAFTYFLAASDEDRDALLSLLLFEPR